MTTSISIASSFPIFEFNATTTTTSLMSIIYQHKHCIIMKLYVGNDTCARTAQLVADELGVKDMNMVVPKPFPRIRQMERILQQLISSIISLYYYYYYCYYYYYYSTIAITMTSTLSLRPPLSFATKSTSTQNPACLFLF